MNLLCSLVWLACDDALASASQLLGLPCIVLNILLKNVPKVPLGLKNLDI